jgi:hypothetical protein
MSSLDGIKSRERVIEIIDGEFLRGLIEKLDIIATILDLKV